jgi:hypothetical protein
MTRRYHDAGHIQYSRMAGDKTTYAVEDIIYYS